VKVFADAISGGENGILSVSKSFNEIVSLRFRDGWMISSAPYRVRFAVRIIRPVSTFIIETLVRRTVP
jgi:hypothetical protein